MKGPDDNDLAMSGTLPGDDDGLGPVHSALGSDPAILVAGSTWLIREGDTYFQVQESLLREHLRRTRPDVELTWLDDEGKPRRKTVAQLYAEYGRRADEVIYELGGTTRFLPRGEDGGTLILGVCRPLEVTPEYHERIAQWLFWLGGGDCGGHPDRLLDWLATCHDLSRPTAALYMRGVKSSGKSMLAQAVTRGWGHHVASFADVVLGSYSGALLRTPIILVDERVPEVAGKPVAALFRDAVTSKSRPLTEKYKASGTLRGCPRIVICANDDDALRLGDSEDRQAEDAIGERILRVVAHPSTGELLESWGGWRETHDWVEDGDGPGRIWRHVAWLRQHHRLSRDPGRLLVYGDPASWLASVTARRGLPREIMLATIRWAARVDLRPDDPYCHVEPEYIRVYVQDLCQLWQKLTNHQRAPSYSAMGAALAKISEKRRDSTSDRRWYYELAMPEMDRIVRETGMLPWTDWQVRTGRSAHNEESG